MRRVLVGLGLGCLLALASACSARAPVAQPPARTAATPEPSPTPVPVQSVPARSAAQAPSSLAAAPSPPPTGGTRPLSLGVQVGHSGADLRVALDVLLQDNTYLDLAAMQAAASGRLDELIGASASLDRHAGSFGQLVGAVNGPATGRRATADWRAASADLVAYAQGQRETARADLEGRAGSLAGELAVGDFPSTAAEPLLRARFDAQLAIADSLAGHDVRRADQQAHASSAGDDDLVRPLAAAIAARQPDQVPAPTAGAQVDVRVSFAQLLVERVYLVGQAEDASGARRDQEQRAAVEAADANAADIGQLIGNAYGAEAASAYVERLRDENAAFVSAAGGGDRQQAASDLDHLRAELDGVVASANVLVPRGLLLSDYRSMDQPLLGAADAFGSHDWASAYERVYEAARQSQHASDALAAGVIDRYPGRFLVTPPPAAGA